MCYNEQGSNQKGTLAMIEGHGHTCKTRISWEGLRVGRETQIP